MRFAVETWTLCDGWVACWHELSDTEDPDNKPLTFATREEAQAEIDELISDVAYAVAAGDMPVGAEYDPADFRIVEVP